MTTTTRRESARTARTEGMPTIWSVQMDNIVEAMGQDKVPNWLLEPSQSEQNDAMLANVFNLREASLAA